MGPLMYITNLNITKRRRWKKASPQHNYTITMFPLEGWSVLGDVQCCICATHNILLVGQIILFLSDFNRKPCITSLAIHISVLLFALSYMPKTLLNTLKLFNCNVTISDNVQGRWIHLWGPIYIYISCLCWTWHPILTFPLMPGNCRERAGLCVNIWNKNHPILRLCLESRHKRI